MKNKWLDVLGDVFQVYNINSKSVLYEFCHPMTVLPASKISGFRYIIRSVVGLVLHLFSLKMSKENKNNRNKTLWKKKIWLIGTTQNQLECLVPVHNEIGESCAIVKALTPQDVFCEVKLLALSLCIYPIAFWRLIRVPNISFKTRCRLLDIFSRALGEGIFWAGKFQQYQPDIVVVANDHSIRNRIIMALTRSKGIKTVYIQHAAVGGIEPRLDAMDVALLHGIRSVDKYRKCGLIHAKIYCVGAPKLDAKNKRLLGQNKNKRVSICPSLEDKISYTEPFFKMLKGTFSSVKFVLRIHPRDRRENLWRDLARSLDIEFCDS